MERLVDADELIEVAHRIRLDSRERIEQMIESAPTVDAVEVVRCKDCKYYWKNSVTTDVPVCLASPKDDAFCSEGERREDEID